MNVKRAKRVTAAATKRLLLNSQGALRLPWLCLAAVAIMRLVS